MYSLLYRNGRPFFILYKIKIKKLLFFPVFVKLHSNDFAFFCNLKKKRGFAEHYLKPFKDIQTMMYGMKHFI